MTARNLLAPDSQPALRLLSLGAGVQSTTVLLMASEDVIPRFDMVPAKKKRLLRPNTIGVSPDLEADEDGDPDGCSPWSCRLSESATGPEPGAGAGTVERAA